MADVLELPVSQSQYEDFMAVAVEKLPETRRGQRALDRIERNGFLGRKSARRGMARYQAAGGEEGTGKGFFEWLVENWETILKMIMDVIGLFGGLGGLAGLKKQDVYTGEEGLEKANLLGLNPRDIAEKIREVIKKAVKLGESAEDAVSAFIAAMWGDEDEEGPELSRAMRNFINKQVSA